MMFRATVRSADGLQVTFVEGPADSLADAVDALATVAFSRFEQDHPDVESPYRAGGGATTVTFEPTY